MVERINIDANMLIWAITRAGHDISDFTIANPRIQNWLDGTKQPTVKQLEDFSKKVYLPFGFLLLPEPPTEELPIPYFRSQGTEHGNVSINVYDTIQLILQRQSWLKEYLLESGFESLSFIGSFSDSSDHIEIANSIRQQLGLAGNWASEHNTWQDALNFLSEVIEDKGIITVFNGVVENNTSRPISVEECRGFVLVDDLAPFMFINNADSKSAQMFTIAHELAHLWTGRSAGFDFRKLQPADDPNEILCDKVAAELLVPENSLTTVWDRYNNIRNTARYFKVSEIVIARRALDLNRITRQQFFDFYEGYINREFSKKGKSSGGDYYATARKRISVTFAAHIENAVKSGQLLYRDAYKLTSMKGDTFTRFFTELA
ncbi:MAG: hypothetical protein DRI97_11720 [Bacteroidetes bacterium]|nr:MAG: hypothetical protein DRI97_11720 [Bacteroidota bacterium]